MATSPTESPQPGDLRVARVRQDERGIAERVAEHLRAAIQLGRYKPGDRLIERKIAAELGVSHIPVREAFARLSEDGLVERLPRRGSRVAALTEADLDEILSLRVVLEQFAVERVVERWNPAIERELRALVAAMVRAAEQEDMRAVADIDVQLHGRLWALADHQMLSELLGQLRGRINRFLRAATLALEPRALVQHARSHENLLDALASGDRRRARREMARHVKVARKRIHAAR